MFNTDQTNESFRQKWSSGRTAFLATTLDEESEIFSWILNRNGFHTSTEFSAWLSPRKRILDAGCGNGRITFLLRKFCQAETEILGIDFSSHEVAQSNFRDLPNTSFAYADLMEDLTAFGSFDLIYCQEVLHHTQNPKQGFLNLVSLLKPQGEIAIYVYKEKAVIREFSDDFVRNKIAHLTLEEARNTLVQITDFARSLSKMTDIVSFPEISILGIKAEQTTVQRFIYNNFFKNFWNDGMSYEENLLVNFDWYHPLLCSRHTMREVMGWYEEANLQVIHSTEDDFGITVRGLKSPR